MKMAESKANVFAMHPIFSKGVVLQREKEVSIWGTGETGREVIVMFRGTRQKTKIDNHGEWCVKIDSGSAGGTYELHAECEGNEMTISDVLVGDVYFAAGQSNMEFPLKDAADWNAAEQNQQDAQIRYYNIYKTADEMEGRLHCGIWKDCWNDECGDISAVAYFFSKKLREKLSVPIGIIGCNVGGSSASCWIREETLGQDEEIKKRYLDPYYYNINILKEEGQRKLEQEYEYQVSEYQKIREKLVSENPGLSEYEIRKRIGRCPWPPPLTQKSGFRPGGYYKAMFYPLHRLTLKAVLWYQGEEDSKYPDVYDRLLRLLIRQWRKDFEDCQLPFFIVQLPGYEEVPVANAWAMVREAQRRVCEEEENTFLVVTLDLGERKDIHPKHKKVLGERVASAALYYVYHVYKENFVYPEICKVSKLDGELLLEAKNLGGTCIVKGGEEKTLVLELSKNGKEFIKAEGILKQNQIRLKAEGMELPVFIRYGWSNYPDVYLYNEEGFPFSPFEIWVQERLEKAEKNKA